MISINYKGLPLYTIGLLLISSCDESSSLSSGKEFIVLRGPINREMADFFASELSRRRRNVLIESKGGSASQALRIAALISKNKLDVRISKYCMSACASIIVPAASRINAEDGSLIILHTTQYGMYQSYVQASNGPLKSIMMNISSQLISLAADEERLLKKSGVDVEYLLIPYVLRGDFCITSYVKDGYGRHFSLASEYAGVALSPSNYRNFNINITGNFNRKEDLDAINNKNNNHKIFVADSPLELTSVRKLFHKQIYKLCE